MSATTTATITGAARMGNGKAVHLTDARGVLCNRWGSNDGTTRAPRATDESATCKRCRKIADERATPSTVETVTPAPARHSAQDALPMADTHRADTDQLTVHDVLAADTCTSSCQACGLPAVAAFCSRPECLTYGSGACAAGPSVRAERVAL